jgi:3'(2'), 5'-bisphosphate nucleotidase
MDYARIVTACRQLALEAGAAILEVYDGPDFDVRAKADASPVTLADERADAIIARGLASAFPDIPVVTEEQAASHGVEAATFFLVDPLDGTKEFVQRRGDFTVNIALIEQGVPTRGVVYAPAIRRLFYTCASGRALEETGPHDPAAVGEITCLRVADPDPAALVVVASKSHRDQATDDYIARYAVKDFRSAGSSLKFCLVAAGEADLYPRLGRTMEWDTAAGQAVLLAAGGRVVRFDDHAPLTYGKAGFENPFFIAHAPGVALVPA